MPNEKVSYKGTLQTGEIFIIIEPSGDYNKSKVFFKKLGENQTEAKVISVIRLDNGGTGTGTTAIETERGNFFFPSSLKFIGTFSELANDIKEREK